MALDFNSTPYFDDYNEFKKFVRILFRPSFAVQARELTQMQTILQNQISRLGDFTFEEGSSVTGGETQIDIEYNYVKLVAPPSIDVTSLIGFRNIELEGTTSGVKARLVNYVGTDGTDPDTIFVKYYDSGDSETQQTFLDGEVINITVYDFDDVQEGGTTSVQAIGADATGQGSAVSITQGIRYSLGFFLLVEAQTIILDKYSNTPTGRIGFKINESIVTEKDDPTLLDNALGSPNESAPGAHRYRIELTLTVTDDINEEDFIELVRLNNGVIEQDYREAKLSKPGILTELAKRTYDANGNFIVENFKSEVREHLNDGANRGKYTVAQGGDESLLAIDLDAGRAYVSGFEVTTTGQETIEIEKARDTASNNNTLIQGDLGAYLIVTNLSYYPDIDNFTTIDLKNSISATIGTARVRSVELNSGTAGNPAAEWRLYLFDIQMNTGESIDNVVSVEGVHTVTFTANVVSFNERANSESIKLFPFESISDVTDITYSVKKTFPAVTVAGGQVVISVGSGQVFDVVSPQNYMVFYTDTGEQVDISGVGTITGELTNTVTINTLDNGRDVVVIATVVKTTPPVAKSKTKITRNSASLTVGTDGVVNLGFADIIEVTSVEYGGEEIRDKYILDDGQRDGFYDLGKLIPINALETPPNGETVEINYTYYSHGPGDYFTVNSYPAGDYETIKTYQSASGKEFDLRNAIDFRPRISNAGTNFTGIGSSKGDFFSPRTLIRGDVAYYLSRIDKIAVDETGNFIVVRGTPEVNPSVPRDPDSGMTIMEVTIPAYTFNPEDVTIDYIERKRFTMDDIGRLESRIENLEYYTSLSLLEKDTADKKILDGLGDERFKTGFVVDSFTGHGIGDTENEEYKCSIDAANGQLRAEHDSDLIDLELESGSGYVQKDDIAVLPYTTTLMAEQPYASKALSVNPNAVISWEGNVKLSPDSSKYFEKKVKPVLVASNKNGQWDTVVKTRRPRRVISSYWGFWQDFWTGRPIRSRNQIRTYNRTRNSRVPVRSIGVPFAYKNAIGSKTLTTGIAPFIKKQDIDFKAKNMKPNTKVYAFFDGVQVGTFTTDSKGKVDGSFTIPDPRTSDNKFRVGERLFRLVDSSTNNLAQATTISEAIFYAKGFRKKKSSNIVSVKESITRTRRLAQARALAKTSQSDNAVSARINWADPIAQTFLVKEAGGAMITDVDLFFASKDFDVPVSIEIREVVNNIPSNEVVPYSQVTVEPEDVSTSADASAATKFTFEAPVYLQEDTEYAIVIMANSSRYRAYVSEVGETTLDGVFISKQPFAGVLYKSNNSSSWVAEAAEDLKFKINKAVFDTSVTATLNFVNEELPLDDLDSDPIQTFSGSQTVRVFHDDHGHFVGSLVTIAGVPADLGGIPVGELNATHTITNATLDYYEFAVSTNATSNTIGGGSAVTATRNIRMDVAQPLFSELKVPGTTSEWSVKATAAGSFNDTTLTPYVKDSVFTKVDIDDDIVFSKPKLVASQVNETNQPELSGEKSLEVTVTMSTNNPNVSPVVDLSRAGMIGVNSRINNDSTDELLPAGGNADAKYVTKKIGLNNAAAGLRVFLNANRPQQGDIEVYYKIQEVDDTTAFESLPWVKMTEEVYPVPNANSDDFSEYEFSAETNEFTAFAVKIVMLSTDSSKVPVIEDFRGIALGV